MSGTTQGVVWIHSTPSALCPHVEWALGGVLGVPVSLDWAPQPVERGSYRAELTFAARPGTAAQIASAFARWGRMRFEVSQEPAPGQHGALGSDGQRFSFTPALGMFSATTGVHGDVLVHEDQLRLAIAQGETGLSQRVGRLLGTPWDDELEVFRHAGDGARDAGANLRWLHQVG